MRETLLTMMEQIQEDATFHVYLFNEDGTFRSGFKEKSFVMNQLEEPVLIKPHESFTNVLMINRLIGVSTLCFSDNIDYKTKGTEGFIEHISQYNSYKKVYIKLDNEFKTITFKLGDKEKTQELIEHTEFVGKPHYKKYMKCVSIKDLTAHIEDEFWNPRMVNIGRDVLGYKDLSFA